MSAVTFASVDKPDDGLPEEIKRDQWGRPLIVPPGGGKPKGYTRISTLCKALDDGSNPGLPQWYGRMTALGVARRPDLQAQAAVLTPEEEDKQELNKLVDEAMAAAGSTRARNLGTAFHRLAEIADKPGGDLSNIPPAMLVDLDAYMQATADLEVIAAEQFVVVDQVEAAGTFDRLVRMPDGRVVIADIKTGKDTNKYPLNVAVQCGLYAHGQRYNPSTGERSPLVENIDRETGLLIHLPAGSGKCTVYELDIRSAMAAAQVAVTIRKWRSDGRKLLRPYKP